MNTEPCEAKIDGRLIAFQEAIDQRLGQNFDKAKRDELLMIQIESFSPQDRLVEAFEQGNISPEAYFKKFAEQNLATLRAFNEVLGERDFVKLFDMALKDAPLAMDPDAFARAHSLDTPPELPENLRGKG
ncbi:MAG: hypothetical protein ACR2RF_20530 [Geminicoccaceae bacterium]